MKKIAVITLFLSLFLVTNCFAVTFRWIEVISDNRVGGWSFITDLLVPSYSPYYDATYSVNGGSQETLTYIHFGPNHVYDSGMIGEEPPYYFGKTFTWTVTDESVPNPTSINATASIPPWAWQVPLSTDFTVSFDADPTYPTVSWKNVPGSPPFQIDYYRLRVLLASDPTKLLWERDFPPSPSVTYTFNPLDPKSFAFQPGVGYLIRIEARTYYYFRLYGDGFGPGFPSAPDPSTPNQINYYAAFLNRSTVFANYVYPKIDIKPGSDPNSINLKSKGVVPVAILTTDGFDATMVDPDTVQFAGASPVRWTMCDVDDDGDQDLLFHFRTQDLDLDENSTEASLTCYVHGEMFEGRDSVNIVPAPKKK
jgi:hypothetical protein